MPPAPIARPPFTQHDLFQITNTLAEYAPIETDAMLDRFYHLATPLIGAQHALWLALTRPNPTASLEIHPSDPRQGHPTRIHVYLQQTLHLTPAQTGDATLDTLRNPGHFRIAHLRGSVPDWKSFRQTDHYQTHYHAPGITDRLWVIFPIAPGLESAVCFDTTREPGFSPEDAARAGTLLQGMGWFHRRLLQAHGIRADQAPLSPTQHQVLRLLLTRKSEKEIAFALGQSFNTTHRHVVTLFKKFDVRSRAELMTLWLR